MTLVFLVLVALAADAARLLRGAEPAISIRIPPLVVGLTTVAVVRSAPEQNAAAR